MSEPDNHTLALLRRIDAKADALAGRLDRVEATMATKVQLGSVRQVLELKLDLLGAERRDDDAALARRLDALEGRVRALEEHEPA